MQIEFRVVNAIVWLWYDVPLFCTVYHHSFSIYFLPCSYVKLVWEEWTLEQLAWMFTKRVDGPE